MKEKCAYTLWAMLHKDLIKSLHDPELWRLSVMGYPHNKMCSALVTEEAATTFLQLVAVELCSQGCLFK